ncbi:ABC transporter permease [Paenibacillus pasadenensis]|uniref:YhgE/Pip domain-containing protein n=1 Tax=Paenibacillus pasadenensis TaxID=217090 RepID=UPI00203B890F|nr:ABC transporter permease [Paenibacillus pasadenensis]MCM3749927.1 ABC transporter permease [Paenibacillus pasadenensis]
MFKQKLTFISVVAVLAVLAVFGLAMMGSVVSVKPKDVPVALVMLDQGSDLPGGAKLEAGKQLQEQLTGNSKLPFKWTVVESEQEARAGIDDRKYYGALILPADMSSDVASLAGPSPMPPNVRILASEGANAQAASAVKQGLNQVLLMASQSIAQTTLQQLSAKSGQLPAVTAKALLSPITVQEETLHAVSANNAGGNAPGLLTQIMWMGSLVTAAALFFAGRAAVKSGSGRLAVMLSQPVVGAVIVGIASAFLVWMASAWYGMELNGATEVWLFLWLAGMAFYAIQSTLLNWIGMPAMAILVLLMFFSMPVLNMAPEFLAEASRDWIYSWTPLRFAAVGLREVMYFGGLDAAGANIAVLWSIGGAFLLLLVLAGLRRGGSQATRQAAVKTA